MVNSWPCLTYAQRRSVGPRKVGEDGIYPGTDGHFIRTSEVDCRKPVSPKLRRVSSWLLQTMDGQNFVGKSLNRVPAQRELSTGQNMT